MYSKVMFSRRSLRPFLGATASVASVSAAVTFYGYFTDEGFRRMVDFNRLVVPIVLHYKWVQFWNKGKSDEEIEAAYKPLHDVYAPRSLEICLRQRGFYIKIGQVVSTVVSWLPEIYAETLKVLQEDCPSQPFSVVKSIVEQELQAPIYSVFQSFSETAIAAASIGQVHTATLLSGQEVVVKVQYLEAERNFHVDMDLFIRACWLLAPEQVGPLQEIQRNFVNEFDYAREAALQLRAAESFKCVPNVVVPLPVDEQHPACPKSHPSGLCTKRVLVMDRLRGTSIQKWSKENLRRLAAQQQKSVEELVREFQRMSLDEIRAKRPSRWTLNTYSVVLRISNAMKSSAAFLYNYSLGWFCRPWHYSPSPRPLNLYDVADTILNAQGHSIFRTGFVNGDPHPGNIMLLDSGKVGLIDWGQVREYTTKQRCNVARLLIAVADGDQVLAANFCRVLGHRTQRDWDWTYYKAASVYLGSFAEAEELGGIVQFEENLDCIDHRIADWGAYIMIARNLILTRLAVSLLGFPEFNSAEAYRSAAVKCLQREGLPLPATVPGRLAQPQPLMLSERA